MDSLRKRYVYKLSTNLIGLVISLVTQAIIPRGLGPRAYGDFNFLTNFFNQIVGFLDMGTSICFYTKLSQRPREVSLVSFYLFFSGLVSLTVIGFVSIIQGTYTGGLIWPNQKIIYIYLAAVWGILTWFVKVLNKMADAYGITVSTEIARMVQKVLGLILIILLFVFHQLQLANFFFYHYVIMAFLILTFSWIMKRTGHSLKQGWKLSVDRVKTYIREFYQYSNPLFVFALVGLIVGIFDRWLLQVFSGSVEQGFFGLSYQIGFLCFLFTSAMTPLITREFAIAYGKQDLGQMAQLFRRYIPLLYSIAAYFSCFIAVQADKVIYIMGGKKFSGAFMAVTIMAFYPIHQTYGQLSGAVFYATGQTALYRNIGLVLMLIGLPVAYFLIASRDRMGLNAGATGLAIKMVLIQFIAVNVQLYYNARLLGLRFWRYLAHQGVSVGCLFGVAFIVTQGVDNVLPFGKVIPRFLLAGVLYTILVMVLFYFQPILFGLKKEDLQLLRNLIKIR